MSYHVFPSKKYETYSLNSIENKATNIIQTYQKEKNKTMSISFPKLSYLRLQV